MTWVLGGQTRALPNGFPRRHGMGLAGAPGVQVVIFFLACVLAAGIFGALTASRKILYIQALPALLALVAVLTQA